MAGRGRNRAVEPRHREIQDYLQRNPDILAELVQRNPQLIEARIEHRTTHAGPLPQPEMLREYREVMPGLDERIVRMAEREQEHRHDIDRGILRIVGRGQWLGFSLGIAGIGGGLTFAAIGMEGIGIAAVLGSIALLAGSLFFGRKGREAVEESRRD